MFLNSKDNNMKYLNRTADKQLSLNLEAFGAVLIEGPKWCGKTTTAMQQAKSVLQLQDPDTREGYLATAKHILRHKAVQYHTTTTGMIWKQMQFYI